MSRVGRGRRTAVGLAWATALALAGAPGADAADSPGVGVDSAGNARFSWRTPGAANPIVAERGLTGSVLGDAEAVSSPGRSALSPRLAFAPDGTATFAWIAGSDLQARRRPTDGSLGPIVKIAGGLTGIVDLAADPNGSTALVWAHLNATGHSVVQTRTLRPDGSLTAIQTVSDGSQSADQAQVAVAPSGDATFAWSRSNGTNGVVQTRTRSAATGTMSAVQDLSDAGGSADQPALDVDAAGDATFAWPRFDGANTVVQARRRTAGGTLSPVQDLSVAGQNAFNASVAVDPADDAVIAWERFNGSNTVIQTRPRAPDGTLGSVTSISSAGRDAEDPVVGIDDAGNASFAWARSNGSDLIAQGRRRSAAGAFGPVLNLSATGVSVDPLVQLDVAPTGDAVYAWQRGSTIQGRRLAADGTLGPTLPVSP